jgi:hypothetical protein
MAKSSMAGKVPFHSPPQAVDFVDEEHIARAQVGQDGGQVAARSTQPPSP